MAPAQDAATVSYIGTTVDTANASSYTLSGVSLGTASNRTVLVITVAGQCGAAQTVSSVTVAGNAATETLEASNGTVGNFFGAALYTMANSALPLGTETSADIVVTFSGTMQHCSVSVFAIYGSSTTVNDSEGVNEGDASVTITLNCPADGVIVCFGVASQTGSDPTTMTWANGTERFDAVPAAGDRLVNSGTSDAYSSQQTNLSITGASDAAGANSSTSVLGVSYGPA
jgi:hypothetical protein